MTTIMKFIVGLVAALFLTSCDFNLNFGQITGNGNVITENMNISESFNEISAGNGWEVILKKGTSNSVIIEADENLIAAAEVYVQDGDLKIYCEKGIGSASSKKVYVTYAQSLEEIRASSGASVDAEDLLRTSFIEFDTSSGGSITAEVAAKEVETEVSSGGVLRLSGTTHKLEASASSGGVAKMENLKSEIATADISSGGVMNIYVSKALKADASSGGIINYYGNPQEVDKPERSNSGGIIRSQQ